MGKNNETEISDLWSSILFNKTTTSNLIPPPYIHPLSNKSSAALSNKSLDICTESLCSETGSHDFFSSSEKPPPPDGFYNTRSKFVSHATTTTHPSRSIPPPLPSLAGGGSGWSSLLVQSRRGDGRLILEAVSFPSSKSCFRAHRVEGRLLLRLENSSNSEEEEDEEEEECRLW